MFEFVTEYNKDLFFDSYKIFYNFKKRKIVLKNILLIIMCFILATASLILEILRPEIFHTTFATIFFYINGFLFLIYPYTINDKRIKKRIDNFFKKNLNDNFIVKYIFSEEHFVSLHDENEIYYKYADIVYFEVVNDNIIIILKKNKFIALNTNDELFINFIRKKQCNR